MCCRTSISPINREIAALILTVGQFKPTYYSPNQPDIAINWGRLIPEEGVTVTASITSDVLDLNLSPAISAMYQHTGKRIAAGVYFEIAAKYAEKVSGIVIQRATVTGCKPTEGDGGLLLARYPLEPMDWSKVCPGFQAVILGGGESA